MTANYVFSHKWGEQGSGDGQFYLPSRVAVDKEGYVYVADTGNNRIQKFRPDGSFIRAWGEHGRGEGQFDRPIDIAVYSFGPSGRVYVLDRHNHRVQKFRVGGTFLGSWGGHGAGDGQFNEPAGIDVDDYGNVYVADYGNHRIQKFTDAGVFLLKWGSHGSGNGQFNWPIDVAVFSHPVSESLGTVYVAEGAGNRIQVFHTNGAYSTKWGSPGSGNGQFDYPLGIDVESAPNSSPKVFVADSKNHRIQQFGFLGLFLSEWGSFGTGDGQFMNTWGVAEYTRVGGTHGVGGTQKVYVADMTNNCIQAFVNNDGPVSP